MNECSVLPDVCGDNARCENTMGSFRCMCNDGFEMRDGTCQGLCPSLLFRLWKGYDSKMKLVSVCSFNPHIHEVLHYFKQ